MNMRLYAIRYGQNFKYGTRNTIFRNCDNPDEKLEGFSFIYYLVEYQGEYILFDVGFRDRALADNMGITLLPVDEEMREVFGKLPNIGTVVLTHSHWDHLNNLDLYKNAKVFISEEAYQTALKECKIESVQERLVNGEICCIGRELLIKDKFYFCVIGGHSPGSSVIRFNEGGSTYIFTGDECYLRENVQNNIPIGICVDNKKNEEFIAVAHSKKWITLPCHDEKMMEEYPLLSANIAQII